MGTGSSKSKFDPSALPALTNKVYLVTGANTGLGLETAKVLASKGATVVMTYRNQKRSQKALDKVTKIAEENGGKVEKLVLDLSDLASVKAAAKSFEEMSLPLHCLINNAGVMMCPKSLTKDGFEMQFGTNHLGHFAFTALVYPILKKTAEETEGGARIVNLTSSYHSKGPREGILFDNLLWDEGKSPVYEPGVAYGHSKFANVVFTQELSNRLGEDNKIIANCVHPGFVDTDLTRHVEKKYGRITIKLFKFRRALNVRDGALTQLYTAISPDVLDKNYRGEYFVPIAQKSPLDKECPEITQEMRTKLWTMSEELTGVKFEV